ncbi:hypothetical protein [Cupriavidus sp. DF5525]|uniref:hypothetical protein n=1 Tax=Cupriavidus sp. DF5525 TaxID=3160989 RepID=UPI0032DEAF59
MSKRCHPREPGAGKLLDERFEEGLLVLGELWLVVWLFAQKFRGQFEIEREAPMGA